MMTHLLHLLILLWMIIQSTEGDHEENSPILGATHRSTFKSLHTRDRHLSAESVASEKKHFLTIMTRVRDEINGILEFVQHYLEEGVDHFYIFDDGSTDGTVEALGCIPSEYYTVFTSADLTMEEVEYFRVHWPLNIMQYEQLYEMYNLLGVRDSSEWVMVVDVDELMVSRAQPQLTIREVLMSKLSHCDIVSVPWLIFTWGTHEHTVPNAVRYRLFDRWGLDSLFAHGQWKGKFRDINVAVNVKAIVKTSSVPVVGSVHWADFRTTLRRGDPERTGLVCISHEAKRLDCAASCEEFVSVNESSNHTMDVGLRLLINKALRGHENCKQTGKFPSFCPPDNEMISSYSLFSLKISERDVDKLLLAIHHYRLVSLEDYERKLNLNRSTGAQYQTGHGSSMKDVNRMDVVDPFMSLKRLPLRRRMSDFTEVEKVMRNCTSDIFKLTGAAQAIENAHAAIKNASHIK